MPREFCLLDLTLEWRDEQRYYLSGRFLDSKTDTENVLLEPVEVAIDTARLDKLVVEDDPDAYGEALTRMVLDESAGAVHLAYERARSAAVNRDGLRVRLNVLTSAPELHRVKWETLRDPADHSRRLLTQDGVWFSRFLSDQNVTLQPVAEGGALRCLVAISNPSDLQSAWGLSPIDVAAEVGRAQAAMTPVGAGTGFVIRPVKLEARASINNIIASVRANYADVLYLCCHGRLIDASPRLLLETDDGKGVSARGEELVERLRDMTEKPRLIVLASCESAGAENGRALAAVGPRLAMAGVPAVVAMQGVISQASAGQFMGAFFRELAKDGQVDRAVAVSRNAIADRPDWWMPVLFTRTRSGRLWPGTAGDAGSFDRWEGIIADLAEKKCVPVLGPGLATSLLGSTREIAKRWAERYEFALAPRDRDDLSQVAQYLRYRHSRTTALVALREYLVSHLRSLFADQLAEISRSEGKDLLTGPIEPGILDKLLSSLGKRQRATNKYDVHQLLAKLPVPLYICANRGSLLRDALIDAGRTPRVLICTWRSMGDAPQHFGERLPKDYEPSTEEPLVFQVFGSLELPKSLVLTEDDYFDFLIAVTRNETLEKAAIPRAVSKALASSGLMLLGFQPDDWDFRVLFRSIVRQPGGLLGEDSTRVAVQLSPVEGPTIDPDRAGRYLSSYFQQNQNTSVFWGSPEEFMKQLVRRCAREGLLTFDE